MLTDLISHYVELGDSFSVVRRPNGCPDTVVSIVGEDFRILFQENDADSLLSLHLAVVGAVKEMKEHRKINLPSP